MASSWELRIGADLPLEEVAARIARAVGGTVTIEDGLLPEINLPSGGGALLEPDTDGEFALDVLGMNEDDARARAHAVFDALAAATPWALTIGAETPYEATRPALTRS